MEIPDSVRDVVASAPFTHLTTLNADGSPQVSLVWVAIEDGEFVTAHMQERLKVRNVRRDPRVVLSFLGEGLTHGLRNHVIATGTARVTDGGAFDLLHQMAGSYLGPDADFPPASMRETPGYVIRTRLDRISGMGPWTS